MADKQKDTQNTKSEQLTNTTHRLQNRQAETFRTQNQSNQPVQLTDYMADKQEDIQNTKSEQSTIQLTPCMADKQKDIHNTKSEQSTNTAHLLHGRQAERHSK